MTVSRMATDGVGVRTEGYRGREIEATSFWTNLFQCRGSSLAMRSLVLCVQYARRANEEQEQEQSGEITQYLLGQEQKQGLGEVLD